MTLERYYAIVSADETASPTTWVRDDYEHAIDGKSLWATEAQWKAYDRDPVAGLGTADDHAKTNAATDAAQARDGIARTVVTTGAWATEPTEENPEGTPFVEGGVFTSIT